MREKKQTEEVSWKKEAVKVLRAVIIFFVVYLSVYKLYHISVHKKLSYDEVYSIYITYYGSTTGFEGEDAKKIIDLFNDISNAERNLDCGQIGTPEYELRIWLKNGEHISMFPGSGSSWAVEWHDKSSMSWLDAWGNLGAEHGLLCYRGESSELTGIWDEITNTEKL